MIARPRWESLTRKNSIQEQANYNQQIVLRFIDASRFYLYVDSIYLCVIALSFLIYVIDPIRGNQSIFDALRTNLSHHQIKQLTVRGVASAVVISATCSRIAFYIVSAIDTAVNGRLKLWRLSKLPPKIQRKKPIYELDFERSPRHLTRSTRRKWLTVTSLSILTLSLLIVLVEYYLQGGDLKGRLIGDSRATINFNLLMLWWWPHQIFSLHNPLAASFVTAKGVDLALSPNNELLSVLLSPISVFAGAGTSLLTIQLLLPMIASLGMYRLARVFGATRFGSLLSGLLFETIAAIPITFSGHLDVAIVCMFPLFAAEIIAFIQGRLSMRRALVAITAMTSIALLTSIGIGIFSILFVAAIIATSALAYGRDGVARVRRATRSLMSCVAVSTLIDAPNIYYALFAHDQITVINKFDLQAVIGNRGGFLLSAFNFHAVSGTLYLSPILIIASIFLICVNLINRQSRAAVIVTTLALTNLVLIVGPSFTFGPTTWPGTLIFGHSIAPLPMTILNSLPGLNLVSQEMLITSFDLLASLLIGIYVSHAFAESRFKHFEIKDGLNFSTAIVASFGVISSIPINSIGMANFTTDNATTYFGPASSLLKCLRGTTTLLELPPNGDGLAIEAMQRIGRVIPTAGISLGYDITYPQSLLESILNFSSHSGIAYLQTFEYEINNSNINSVITSSAARLPWSSYVSSLGSNYHPACSSKFVTISRR